MKPTPFYYGRLRASKTHIRYEPPKPPNSLHPNPEKQQSSRAMDTVLDGIDGDGVVVAYVYCDFSVQNAQSASTY